LALPFVLPFFPGDFFVFVSFGLPVNIYQENLPQWVLFKQCIIYKTIGAV
jgi:hypothetical protein